jgi:hypothetical protein
MNALRGAFGLIEVLEAIGYLATFFVLLMLLLTGRVPRDSQLGVEAVLGAMVLIIIVAVIAQRYSRRNKS